MRPRQVSGVIAIVLAGGQGERLYPLTRDRAKPAVPFGGSCTLIDFTLSNCLHGGIRRIHVLTQYKSDSLCRHIRLGWDVFNPEIGEYVEVNPPQLRLASHWYLGTADAIHQNIYTLERGRPRHVLLLSGDHVYKMDYGPMLMQHVDRDADLTIACIQTPLEEAKRLGVVSVGEDLRAVDFKEKPACPEAISKDVAKALCSMGVYVFKTETLVRRVVEDAKKTTSHDFGQDVIPTMIRAGDRVLAFEFARAGGQETPYWRDIGTIDAYWEANMDLVRTPPLFSLHDPEWPIRSRGQCGPPMIMTCGDSGRGGERDAQVHNSLIGGGCVLRGASVRDSVIGPDVHFEPGASVSDSVITGSVRVGRDAVIRRTIVDKGNAIPDGFLLGVDPAEDGRRFHVSEGGVVVVPKEMPLFRPPGRRPDGGR